VDASERTVEAVRVTVGNEQLLVPTGHLQTIVEYQLHAQIPFLHPWVRGVGLFDDNLYPVTRISRQGSVAAADTAGRPANSLDIASALASRGFALEGLRRGLLLHVDGVRFLLDIDGVVGFGRCRIIGASHFQSWAPHLPPDWLVDGATDDREVLPTVNAAAVKGVLHA
jgi:hypothetical protein